MDHDRSYLTHEITCCQVGGARGDVDLLQEFQRLRVEQVDGRTTAEGHPDPPTRADHVANAVVGVAVGLKPLLERDRRQLF